MEHANLKSYDHHQSSIGEDPSFIFILIEGVESLSGFHHERTRSES